MKRRVLSVSIISLLACTSAMAQVDTVLTFTEAKARMIRYNTGLLASYYDVNIAKARVIVARQWNNPNMVFNGDMWNSETNEYLATRNQHLFQFEQIFGIAGKHINSVKLARIGVEMAEKQMQDV